MPIVADDFMRLVNSWYLPWSFPKFVNKEMATSGIVQHCMDTFVSVPARRRPEDVRQRGSRGAMGSAATGRRTIPKLLEQWVHHSLGSLQ